MLFTRFAPIAALFLSLSAQAYYGRNAQEAILTYQAPIEVDRGLTTAEIREAIEFQIEHLMGSFQAASFQESFRHPGVLGENHRVKILSKRRGRTADTQTVTYSFEGKVVFQKTLFGSSLATKKVPIVLPLNPNEIYALGMNSSGTLNLCTDEHYNSEGDFWYFWDVGMENCPLAENTSDVLRISGRLKPLKNTTLTYPEYDLLYGDNGNGDLTEISFFLGYIDEIRHVNRPMRRDDAFATLKFLEKDLKERGFEKSESRDAFRVYANGSIQNGANFWRVYEKTVRALGRETTVRVNILLADTELGTNDTTFHSYLVPALESSDIVIYDGHSGLGGNLDLANLPAVSFDPSKYQIFFFNGCSSYPYFNGTYLNAKGGSKMLDVITSGLPTLSYTSGPNAVAFANRFLEGKTTSYQKILSELEASNDDAGTYLMGVSGDEDNSFRP